MKIVLISLAAAWSLMTPEVRAADLDMENDTGRTICELRWSAPGEFNWRDDLLKGACLDQGRSRRTAADQTDGADLLAVFENGDYLVYYGLELGSYRHLKLREDEAELFEWNPAAAKP